MFSRCWKQPFAMYYTRVTWQTPNFPAFTVADNSKTTYFFFFLEKWKVGPMRVGADMRLSSPYSHCLHLCTHWAFAMAQESGRCAHCPHGASRLVLKVDTEIHGFFRDKVDRLQNSSTSLHWKSSLWLTFLQQQSIQQ